MYKKVKHAAGIYPNKHSHFLMNKSNKLFTNTQEKLVEWTNYITICLMTPETQPLV